MSRRGTLWVLLRLFNIKYKMKRKFENPQQSTPSFSDKRAEDFRQQREEAAQRDAQKPYEAIYHRVNDALGFKAEGYVRSAGHPFATREEIMKEHTDEKEGFPQAEIRVETNHIAMDISVKVKTTEELNALIEDARTKLSGEGKEVRLSPAWHYYTYKQ